MKRNIFLLLIIAIIAISCKKHLDRMDAKRMIIENNNYPIKRNYNISKAFIKDMNTEGRGVSIVLGEDETKKEEEIIKQFESLGLLQLEETPQRQESTAFLFGTTVRTWTSVRVILTDAGKNYLALEKENAFVVYLWETDVNDITGVQEFPEQKFAKVDYTIFNKNITPFGSIFSDQNEIRNCSASFSLYDDGWRIQ